MGGKKGILGKKLSRREFLKLSAIGIGGTAAGIYGYKYLFNRNIAALPKTFPEEAPESLWKWSKEAMHYTKLGENVECSLCPHQCILEPGDRGICRDRVNIKGKLYSLVYGNPCSVHVDPIEKKPMFHFLPGTGIFSIATAGCNLRCLNCQNWQMSQFAPEETNNYDLMPEKVVEASIKNNCRSVAYTYSEPISFYEYMYDTSVLAKKGNLRNVMVTAGYINEKPFRELCQVIDAANIDLKGIREKTYNELNGCKLEPILDMLKVAKDEGIWFEITNLIVPEWTDDVEMITELINWLVKNGFENYPLHFSRFHPAHKLTHLPPTPLSILKKAREIAMDAGIKYVYIGNVPNSGAEDTICPRCKREVIKRIGYRIIENNMQDGTCSFCGEKIHGVWK